MKKWICFDKIEFGIMDSYFVYHVKFYVTRHYVTNDFFFCICHRTIFVNGLVVSQYFTNNKSLSVNFHKKQ